MPFLKCIQIHPEMTQAGAYPFTLPIFSGDSEIQLENNITFFVGENGSGKSTLLEAVAACCGFNVSGGNRNHVYAGDQEQPPLAKAMRLSWMPKITSGFFMRAESFFNFASYLDDMAVDDPSILNAYGGKSLHQQSHGESFLSLFTNHFSKGIYILDEPEAALSPSRQLSFLAILHELDLAGKVQFIIASHSPILISYPGATIYTLDGNTIQTIPYEETQQYRLTKDFLDHPQLYLRSLFAE